jgi:hypothetical protein
MQMVRCYINSYPRIVLIIFIQAMRTVTFQLKLSAVRLVNYASFPSLFPFLTSSILAEQQSGSVIIIEHRFYGLSNPIDNLKSESLKYHTIQQAIDDLEYFTKNVILPQPNGDQLTPDKARTVGPPWW